MNELTNLPNATCRSEEYKKGWIKHIKILVG